VLLSGGIDSATALYLTKAKRRVRAITFEYAGIARREVDSAKAIGKAGVVEHRVVRLPDMKEASEIPGFSLGGRPPTYIPMRNAIFYSIAASYAEETEADIIVGGHNMDDRRVFEDVSARFFNSLQGAVRAASPVLRGRKFGIARPLSLMSKPEVVRLAASLGVPLDLTWSCHRDGREHCWACSGCLSRMRVFALAKVEDPLLHRARTKIT
jgi:7-cyano-7-deazaguanine synthase